MIKNNNDPYGNVKLVSISENMLIKFLACPNAIDSNLYLFKIAKCIDEICSNFNTSWIFKSYYGNDYRSFPHRFPSIFADEWLQMALNIFYVLSLTLVFNNFLLH